MIKRTLRSTLIFLGIISIIPLCYLFYGYLAQYSWTILPTGDGQAFAITWLDSNANGIKEPDEKNLPDICLWSAYSPEGGVAQFNSCENSDQQGEWGEFLPGGSCDEIFIFAQSPNGFHPTTDLVSDGCDARFGFAQDNVPVNHKVLNIDEYIQRHHKFTVLKQTIIGLIILVVGILGTRWLEKSPE